MITISNKDVYGLLIRQHPQFIEEYNDPTSSFKQYYTSDKYIRIAQPKSDWAYTDLEGHFHCWEKNIYNEMVIPSAIEIEKEGKSCFYCTECEEDIYPEYYSSLIPNCEIHFEYYGEVPLSVGNSITITDNPIYGNIELTIQRIEMQTGITPMNRGRYVYKVQGYNSAYQVLNY